LHVYMYVGICIARIQYFLYVHMCIHMHLHMYVGMYQHINVGMKA
jgi:hypothetical protein